MAVTRKKGLGLLPRLLLGVFIPIVVAFLVIGVMVFTGWNLYGNRLSSLRELGSGSLKELSAASLKESKPPRSTWEKIIEQKAKDVAAQIEIFVRARPKLKKEKVRRIHG
jgi:hypothetical protein